MLVYLFSVFIRDKVTDAKEVADSQVVLVADVLSVIIALMSEKNRITRGPI